jgi:hypothetical protein
MTSIVNNKRKHMWTEEDIRIVCSICQKNKDNKLCEQKLSIIFQDCSSFSIKMIVKRYNTLNECKDGWGTNVSKKFKKVWSERDWSRSVL